jgi:hypothetical protein
VYIIQRDSLEKIILNYFMDNLFNENLFSGDSVLFSERKNLFESQIYKNLECSVHYYIKNYQIQYWPI